MAALATLFFTSCNKDEQKTDSQNVEIHLSSATLSMKATRAMVATQFEDGENISVFINEDAATPTTIYNQPLQYTADGSGGMTPPTDKQPFFPQSGNGVNIYACYPSSAASTVGTPKDFTVQTNQNSTAFYKQSDLMLGLPFFNPVVRKSTAVSLTFTHQLSKVNVTLTAGDGLTSADLANATIKLKGLLPTITFNPMTGITGTAKGSSTDITVASAYAAASTVPAIIVPQAVAQNAPLIEVTLASGGVLTYNLAAATTFQGGKEYNYNITVKLTGLSVTSTITEWSPMGTVTGDATM